jgi:hypothetical protein
LFSVIQLVDSKHSEEAQKRDLNAAFAKALTKEESFLFRFPVHPDGTPYIIAAHAFVTRPFWASGGYRHFFEVCYWSGGMGDQTGITIAPFKYASHEQFMLDVAEVAVIHWLRSPSGMNWTRSSTGSNRVSLLSTNNGHEDLPLSVLCRDFPHNELLKYLANRKDPFVASHFVNQTYNPIVVSITGSCSTTNHVRTIKICGTSFVLSIEVQYTGRGALSSQECDALGLPLRYNTYDLPCLNTEDFRIRAQVCHDLDDIHKLTPAATALPADTVSRFVRDFDWSVLRDNLLFTNKKS